MRLKKSQLGYIVIDGQYNEALKFNECYSYYPTKFAAELFLNREDAEAALADRACLGVTRTEQHQIISVDLSGQTWDSKRHSIGIQIIRHNAAIAKETGFLPTKKDIAEAINDLRESSSPKAATLTAGEGPRTRVGLTDEKGAIENG